MGVASSWLCCHILRLRHLLESFQVQIGFGYQMAPVVWTESGPATGLGGGERLGTQVITSFEMEKRSNTLRRLKDISAVLNEGEEIETVIRRSILRV